MDIAPFLRQIAGINKRYEEIAKATGENFNIFDILNIETKELAHSNFIAIFLTLMVPMAEAIFFLNIFLKSST
jgi:hypothetical protein